MHLKCLTFSTSRSLGLLLFMLAASSRRIAAFSTSLRMMASKNVVSKEEQASLSETSSKEFLLGNPSGAYTTARTCAGGTRIFEWESHVQRTANSIRAMTKDASSGVSSLSDPFRLRRRLDASVEAAVRLYKEEQPPAQDSDELKITALVCPESDSVRCHVTALPPLPAKPVRVEVRGSPRTNAAAKDSSWVSDRAPLEALMAQCQAELAPINELLLTNQAHEVLEGSQTNFYAIVDGTVVTAQEGILAGTVRGLVLDVCRAEGIPVLLEPPSLQHEYDRDNNSRAPKWEGALLSSTSRLALPIDELYIPTPGKPSQKSDLRMAFDNDKSSLARRIQSLVALEVEARSTPIGAGDPVLR